MDLARKKAVKEKNFIDQMLDSIDFRGLTQDEVAGQNGIIKQLTGRILQWALEASNLWFANRSISDFSPLLLMSLYSRHLFAQIIGHARI